MCLASCTKKCATCLAGVLEQIFKYKIQVATCTKYERSRNSAFPVCDKLGWAGRAQI